MQQVKSKRSSHQAPKKSMKTATSLMLVLPSARTLLPVKLTLTK
jgi:hypothetical protein